MSQKGTALVATAAPLFSAFIVIKDSWRERDNTNVELTADDANGTINFAYDDPGVDATCDWVVKDGQTPAAIGDEVAETNGDTRKFIVQSVETFNYGGRATRQSVTLLYKASLDSALGA